MNLHDLIYSVTHGRGVLFHLYEDLDADDLDLRGVKGGKKFLKAYANLKAKFDELRPEAEALDELIEQMAEGR